MAEATDKKAAVTVIIPTLNEERNIARSLGSVLWADQIFIYDSHSSDRTLEIVGEFPDHEIEIVQRTFTNFADHKNWALDNLPARHDWILWLDADEVITGPLRAEILARLADPEGKTGFYIARKNLFAGKWVRHADMYPDHNLRFFRRGTCRYEPRIVHEHMVADGPVGYLKEPMEHHDYKGIERYIDRHNTYSSLEAIVLHRDAIRGTTDDAIEANIFGNGPERRRALKNFANRYLPARALFVFLWMYFVRLGFLDGRIGLRYCLLRAFYEYQIDLKRLELERSDSPLAEKYKKYLEDDV